MSQRSTSEDQKLPFELGYSIWSQVLEEIDDLFAIVGLVGYNPQLDQIVQLYLNSQDILFDFDTVLPTREESERKWILQLITKSTTTSNKSREIDTIRSKPSHSPITYQVLKAYCCLMYQHNLRFNSITIGSHIPYSSVDQMRVYPEYELLLELSREIKLECNHNAFLKSLSLYSMDWLYDVTSLKVSKFFIQLDAMNRFPNLNELTIDAGHLFDVSTVAYFSNLLDYRGHLQKLTFQYCFAKWDISEVTLQFCEVLDQFHSLHPDTKIEFIFSKPDKFNLKRHTNVFHWPLAHREFLPLLRNFKRMNMIPDQSIEDWAFLKHFTSLEELTLSFPNANELTHHVFQLQNSSLKYLVITDEFDQRLDFKGLTSLKTLELSDVSISGESLDTLPDSTQVLYFKERVSVEGEVSRLPINLQRFVMEKPQTFGSFLKLSRRFTARSVTSLEIELVYCLTLPDAVFRFIRDCPNVSSVLLGHGCLRNYQLQQELMLQPHDEYFENKTSKTPTGSCYPWFIDIRNTSHIYNNLIDLSSKDSLPTSSELFKHFHQEPKYTVEYTELKDSLYVHNTTQVQVHPTTFSSLPNSSRTSSATSPSSSFANNTKSTSPTYTSQLPFHKFVKMSMSSYTSYTNQLQESIETQNYGSGSQSFKNSLWISLNCHGGRSRSRGGSGSGGFKRRSKICCDLWDDDDEWNLKMKAKKKLIKALGSGYDTEYDAGEELKKIDYERYGFVSVCGVLDIREGF
ncbi:unnamed protein product [Ambrosiozyma monospora]|uniref:Unnamed protein product n=1 Tax=Ambrosiozyma monospora TaxID=43982 RepID=A0A9W6WMU8_AMBMO|nr:unnamed protein product [Ambrosiozyma monospora]